MSAGVTLGTATGGADEAVEGTLRRRVQEYARAPATAEAGAEAEVLLFALRGEHYAAESRLLVTVHRAAGLMAVPCTPPHVAGMLNVRGEVITVLDLAVGLGLAGAAEPSETSQVLLVELPEARVGLLVDDVIGVQRLSLEGLDPPLSGREFSRGVAGARIVVLDLALLLSGGRFDVLEEVG